MDETESTHTVAKKTRTDGIAVTETPGSSDTTVEVKTERTAKEDGQSEQLKPDGR